MFGIYIYVGFLGSICNRLVEPNSNPQIPPSSQSLSNLGWLPARVPNVNWLNRSFVWIHGRHIFYHRNLQVVCRVPHVQLHDLLVVMLSRRYVQISWVTNEVWGVVREYYVYLVLSSVPVQVFPRAPLQKLSNTKTKQIADASWARGTCSIVGNSERSWPLTPLVFFIADRLQRWESKSTHPQCHPPENTALDFHDSIWLVLPLYWETTKLRVKNKPNVFWKHSRNKTKDLS